MPANPKALAIQQGTRTQREWLAADFALTKLSVKRAEAIQRCLKAGCTLGETAEIFGISRTRVQQLAKVAV